MPHMPHNRVEKIPVYDSNYIYILHDTATDTTLVVDPGLAAPVLEFLDEKGWALTHILVTHHHADHIDGVEELKRVTGCSVIGSALDARRIPAIDRTVADGDVLQLGGFSVHVIGTPGHTLGHLCYYLPEEKSLFTGDTLFLLGCGRLFEGTPAQMWASLCRLRALPDDTMVWCGHEYTEANLGFARSILPYDGTLATRAAQVQTLRTQGHPTVPGTLGEEKATNPFLRADQPDVAHGVNMAPTSDPLAVFTELRHRKDIF